MHGNGVVKVNHRRRSRLAAGFLLRAVHKREEGAACATAHGRGAETFPTLFQFDSVLGSRLVHYLSRIKHRESERVLYEA